MPKSKSGRPKSGKSGKHNAPSPKARTDSALSKASVDPDPGDHEGTPPSKEQGTRECTVSSQLVEKDSVQLNDLKEELEEANLCEEHKMDGQAKKKKKKKNKQQQKDEIDEVDKQVEDIKKLDNPQEKLWNSIEKQCKGCPEPIYSFFDKLAHGKHWTFFKDLKSEEISCVLELCKSSDSQEKKEQTQENKQVQQRGKRGEPKGKRNENNVKEESKNHADDIDGLRKCLKETDGEVDRLKTENFHIKQNSEKIYQQLKVRDEQYHQLQNEFHQLQTEYHKVEQNVSILHGHVKMEQEKYKKLEEINQEIAKERDEFKDRFSKLAGAKLTAGNARIQDLSDVNRPQKLAEKYSELYDNEWTDAIEEIQENTDFDEKAAVLQLLELFQICVSFCQLKSEEQEMGFMSAVKEAVELKGGFLCNGSLDEPEQQEAEVQTLSPTDSKILKDFLKAKGGTSLTFIQRMFQTDEPKYASSGPKVQAFLHQSLEVCWYSAIQDPALAFDWNFKEGSEMIDKYVKVFTKSGTKVDYVVWPVLKLHADGDVLCKGVIQPFPEGKKKKKKDSK